jgi:hypothetical protein
MDTIRKIKMAKIKLNPIFASMSGKMGDVIFKTSKNGQTYISMCPRESNAEPSEAQLARRNALGQASRYAKAALADEATRAFYEALAEASNTNAHSVCTRDYLNAPTIDDLDLSSYHGQIGDRIRITTNDDVGVVEVNVELTMAEPNGSLIEDGKAVELYDGSGYWEYVATVPVPLGAHIFIYAEAFDRPRNRATASADPIVGESH